MFRIPDFRQVSLALIHIFERLIQILFDEKINLENVVAPCAIS